MEEITTPDAAFVPIRFIDLTLSGGGFRATLYHLGVIGYLHEAKLLNSVSTICSVSGGSILAGHLIANWEEYTRSLESFRESAEHIINWIKSTDLTQLVLDESHERLVDFKTLDSSKSVKYYDEFLTSSPSVLPKNKDKPIRWDDLPEDIPHLYVLGTELSTEKQAPFAVTDFG